MRPVLLVGYAAFTVGALTLLALLWRARPRRARPRRPRHFREVPPCDVRAVVDRRGELWAREDDAGTYWVSRGLRCHVMDLLAGRGPLVEVWSRSGGYSK